MYRQPMTSSVPGQSTVNVKPVRSAKSRACLSRSPRLASSDMPSTGGQPQDSKPGVARMCAMLDIHAAWSDSLCCAPSGTRWNSGSSSSCGGSKSSGTKGSALTALRLRRAQHDRPIDPDRGAAVAWGERDLDVHLELVVSTRGAACRGARLDGDGERARGV